LSVFIFIFALFRKYKMIGEQFDFSKYLGNYDLKTKNKI
jgi:hypothetical protein